MTIEEGPSSRDGSFSDSRETDLERGDESLEDERGKLEHRKNELKNQ